MTYGRKKRSCTIYLDHFHLITSISETGQGYEIDQIPEWLWISPHPHVTAILTVLKLFCFAELLNAFPSPNIVFAACIFYLFFQLGQIIYIGMRFFFFFKEWFKKFLHFCSLLLQCGKCVFGFHCKVSKSDVTGGRDSKAKNCFKLNRQSGLKSWG